MVTTTNTLYIVGSGARLFSLSPPGGHDMKVILREDTSGVSEVIGTILILSMTVVLFSVIIIWVGSIPTPVAQSRLDLRSQMDPIYNGAGVEVGVNITLTHQRTPGHAAPGLHRQMGGRGLGDRRDRSGPGATGLLSLRESHGPGWRPEPELGVCDDHRMVRVRDLVRDPSEDEGRRRVPGQGRRGLGIHIRRERLHEPSISRAELGRIHHPP